MRDRSIVEKRSRGSDHSPVGAYCRTGKTEPPAPRLIQGCQLAERHGLDDHVAQRRGFGRPASTGTPHASAVS